MAGPAIRAWEISGALASEHEVRLVTFATCEREAEGFSAEHIEIGQFRAAVDWADVVVLQGYVAATFPWLREADVVLVADLYDPFHLESLEVQRDAALPERDAALANALRELDAQVSRGDVFLCASPRQRDLWFGHLAAAGRINALTYDDDPSLDSLVKVVPFGVSERRPVQRTHAIKGTVPGIGADDPVILWGGGVYNWFDPITLVAAVDRLRDVVPNVRLYFLGMKHPNPDVPAMRVAARTRALSDERGLTGVHVFFNEEWVPYETRADFLLDADVGVSCHFRRVETEFSFRTRILDYLWAGLPIVATDGDAFAGLIHAEGLGRVVPPEDVDALVEALREVLVDSSLRDACRVNVERVAEQFVWPRVLEPLVAFCREPVRAADHALLAASEPDGTRTRRGRTSLRAACSAAIHHFRSGGLRQVLSRVRWHLSASRQR